MLVKGGSTASPRARLLSLVFEIDLQNFTNCAGQLKIIGAILEAAMHVFMSRAKFDTLPHDLQQIVRNATQAAALRMTARNFDRNALAMRVIEARGIDAP